MCIYKIFILCTSQLSNFRVIYFDRNVKETKKILEIKRTNKALACADDFQPLHGKVVSERETQNPTPSF